MKIRLIVTPVNTRPLDRPSECPYCHHLILHRHGVVPKPVKDHGVGGVEVVRYKCVGCNRTFRHYPQGVTARDQSQRTVVLAALMYGLGLSCSASSHLLRAVGADIGKMSVWRDAQQAGEVLRNRPGGKVTALGVDETVFRVRGREVVVGFVTDARSGRCLGFEILSQGDGEAFAQWLKPYVEGLGVEVLVTDDNHSYGVASRRLLIEHQLCITHLRKYVRRRSRSILEQAEREWGERDPKLERLREDMRRVRELIDVLDEEGGRELGHIHLGYIWAVRPEKQEPASAGYRMRLLTLKLWEKWLKLRLYLRRPQLGLDGTNNCTEPVIGRSKVRYTTMRGYKSLTGMENGIRLTQWLYSVDEPHDLTAAMAA